MRNVGSVVFLLALGAYACKGKVDASKQVSDDAAVVAPAGGASGTPASVEMAKPELLLGQWTSSCVVNSSSSLVPGNVGVYQFYEDGSGDFRVLSYRDSLCEQRYTKADADKVKAQVQAEAQSFGGTVSAEELAVYDNLWSPPKTSLQYKLGRKYPNGLIELDLTITEKGGATRERFLTLFFDEGLLYFAQVCAEADAQLGYCGPVAGDKTENRGKNIDFNVSYEHRDIVKPP